MNHRLVILHLLNAHPDPQYAHHYPGTGGRWPADLGKLTVIPSILEHSEANIVVLHDCFPPDLDHDFGDRMELVHVPPYEATNAYFARWACTAWYLREHGHNDLRVWCTDGGDVEMRHDPFPHMADDLLYIGCEPNAGKHERHVGFSWCRQFHPDHAEWIEENASRDLLNPGLLGGDAGTVLCFADLVAQAWPTADGSDVLAANRVAYDFWLGRIITGDQVHTRYWSYERNDHSWWSHK